MYLSYVLQSLFNNFLSITQLNTFQCVLASDGQHSFVTFLYPRGGTTGDDNGGLGGTPAVIGFNAGDWYQYYTLRGSGTHDVINIDEGSNTIIPGVYIYQVTLKKNPNLNDC